MRNEAESGFPRRQGRGLRAGLGGAVLGIVALMVACSLPSVCHAECGDYVLQGEHGRSDISQPQTRAAAKSMPPGTAAHDRPAQPCRGPHCSQGKHAPTPLPTTVPPSVEEWGFMVVCFALGNSLSTHQPFEELSLSPRWFTQSIFHPPRS